MTIRVALFAISLDTACGWGRTSVEFARALERAGGVTLKLVVPETKANRMAARSGDLPPITWTHAATAGSHGNTVGSWRRRLPIGVCLRDIDLVHALTDYPYCITAFAFALRARRPLVVWLHGTYAVRPLDSFLSGLALRSCYAYASQLIAVSQYTKSAAMSKAGISPEKCIVLPNAYTPPAHVSPEQPDVSYRHETTLLTVGPLKDRKGQAVVVEALHLLRQQGCSLDIGYVLVGDDSGPYAETLRERVRRYGLEGHVHILGRLPQAQLEWLYAHSDVYIHTPVVHCGAFEGYGLVYLEAGYHGLPVIAANSGGASEAVDHGENGLVVPENDPAATANAIAALATDPLLRARLGEAGRKKATSWTWANYAQHMKTVYQNLVRGRDGRTHSSAAPEALGQEESK